MAVFMIFLIGIPLLVYLFYKAVEYENNKLTEQRRVAEAVKQSFVRKKEAEKVERIRQGNHSILNTFHERRRQILNESTDIISKSKNISTLKTRKQEVLDCLAYFMDVEKRGGGYFIKPSASEGCKLFYDNYNENIVRAIGEICDQVISNESGLKTRSGKQKRINAAKDDIGIALTEIFNESPNANECTLGLNIHYNKLEEYESTLL